MIGRFPIVAAVLLSALPASAATTILNFDDVGVGPVVFFSTYGGLTWDPRWAVVNAETECVGIGCGFRDARTSGGYVGTNGFDGTGSITYSGLWQAVSLQLGSAWYNGLSVSFEGLVGGNQIWTQDVVVNATGSSLVTFDTRLIDELRVTATITPTSTYYYQGGSGPRMVWDDFAVNLSPEVGAVPEPGSWAMMLIGFAMLGAGLRHHRRRRTRVNFVAPGVGPI